MARAESEVLTIESAGKQQLLLSVVDFLDWMKSRDILVGPGWSTTPGFLVSYALGLSDLDPMFYGLLSERCLGPNGTRGFEIWLSADASRFTEIIEYLGEVFGVGNVNLDPERCYSGLQCYLVTLAGEVTFRITADPALYDLQTSFEAAAVHNANCSSSTLGNIPFDDTTTWNYIAGNESANIFTGEEDRQLAENTARFHPDTLVELAAIKALCVCRRPDLIEAMLKRKNLPESNKPANNSFSNNFAETHGIPVFQEDLFIALHQYAEYDLLTAAQMYRGLCKKKGEVTNAIRNDFLEREQNLVRPITETEAVFDYIQKNAVYLGMKSHHLAWALVKYRQAFWKTRELR